MDLSHAVTPEEAGTLDGLLRERARRTPDAIAYRDFNRTHANWRDYTWAQIDREVARWQAALEGEGLAAGDRVAVMMRNAPEWAVFDQAALGLGLVVVPLYTQDRPDNVAYILNDAECRVLLFGSFLIWAVLDFRASRRRDRENDVSYPPGTLLGSFGTLAIGTLVWFVFVRWLHALLIGVSPLGM